MKTADVQKMCVVAQPDGQHRVPAETNGTFKVFKNLRIHLDFDEHYRYFSQPVLAPSSGHYSVITSFVLKCYEPKTAH